MIINLNSLGLEEEEEAEGKQVKLRSQVFFVRTYLRSFSSQFFYRNIYIGNLKDGVQQDGREGRKRRWVSGYLQVAPLQ